MLQCKNNHFTVVRNCYISFTASCCSALALFSARIPSRSQWRAMRIPSRRWVEAVFLQSMSLIRGKLQPPHSTCFFPSLQHNALDAHYKPPQMSSETRVTLPPRLAFVRKTNSIRSHPPVCGADGSFFANSSSFMLSSHRWSYLSLKLL